jgi:hypothetical protein
MLRGTLTVPGALMVTKTEHALIAMTAILAAGALVVWVP